MIVLENKKSKLFEKLNSFADWFIRITVINILVILFMIPIITIIPSLSAGYRLFSDYINKEEEGIFKGFWKYFKEDIVNKIILSVILVIFLVVGIYNNTLYGKLTIDSPSIFNTIGYYITMALILAIAMVALYLPVVFSERQGLEIIAILKLAFYLAGKYILNTILITLTLLIPYIMLILHPTTQLLFVFSGISIPLLINAALTVKARKFLRSLEAVKND